MTGQTQPKVPYDLVPQSRLQRVTARRLRKAVPEKPQVTLHVMARMDALLAERRNRKQEAGDAQSMTVTAVLAAVVAAALARWGRLNGHINGDEIRQFREVHLGVAVDTGQGLVVPVVRDAHLKTLNEIATEIDRLANKARINALHPAELVDATFTVTNLGMHGVQFFTPLVNPPQLAILGVGATSPALAMVDGHVTERHQIGLSLSFDHAAIDGAEAAAFLQRLVELIENPADTLRSRTSIRSSLEP